MYQRNEVYLESNKYFFVFLALGGILISGFSIDIYSPSLPAVTTYFNVDKSQVQFTITTYLIGFGLSQLFAGSLSDSIGRKYIIITAISAYCVFSGMIPYSQTIYQLQILRLFQGCAVAFINVPTRAIIADLFEGAEFYKMMNYVTIAWAIGPIIAPAIGGYLQHYINWYASFYFLMTYGFILLILYILYLPETIKIKQPFKGIELLRWYWLLITNKDYFLGIICLGSLYAMLILFGLVAPFLIQNVLHYTALQFGYMALLMGSAWFLGNITNRFLLHVKIAKKVKISFLLMFLITLVMLAVAIKETINIYDIILPASLLFYFGGLVFPNYFAQNIAIFQHISGYANGLMGALIVLMAGIGSAAGTLLKSYSQVPLTSAYMFITTICFICCLLIKHTEVSNTLQKNHMD